MHLVRHDGLATLRDKKIAVPSIFTRGAWITAPLGSGESDLGPTKTQLLIWLPRIDGEPTAEAIEAAIGSARRASSRTVSREAIEALVNAEELPREALGDRCVVAGEEHAADAFGSVFWRHGWVLRAQRGVLVSLISG